MLIRPARTEDAQALLAIYAPYVEKTAVTFELETPSASEFERRICEISRKYPYLTAEDGGEPVGFAYASVFKNRAAYDRCVETSIYLKPSARGRGIGRALYTELESALREQGILNAYACISYAEREDETLDHGSVRFHERMGYRLCGTFRQCGYKFGRWYDMIWMGKMLGSHE